MIFLKLISSLVFPPQLNKLQQQCRCSFFFFFHVGVVLEARWFRQEMRKMKKNLMKVERGKEQEREREKVVDFRTFFVSSLRRQMTG